MPISRTAMAAQAAAPVLEAMFTAAVVRLGRRRVDRAAETLVDAAAAADMPLPEFMDKAVSDDGGRNSSRGH
jgi:hypothetical protein